jgi:hypothetical protein
VVITRAGGIAAAELEDIFIQIVGNSGIDGWVAGVSGF